MGLREALQLWPDRQQRSAQGPSAEVLQRMQTKTKCLCAVQPMYSQCSMCFHVRANACCGGAVLAAAASALGHANAYALSSQSNTLARLTHLLWRSPCAGLTNAIRHIILFFYFTTGPRTSPRPTCHHTCHTNRHLSCPRHCSRLPRTH